MKILRFANWFEFDLNFKMFKTKKCLNLIF
jgi:hypothetical protein